CEIKSFSDYETYCASCVPRDKKTIVFIIDDDHVFEVPLNLKFLNEIVRALQGQNIKLLFESEDLCSCGNRKYKKNSKCKECHENLLKELVPLCGSCKKRK
ncbi:31125_t:CDS:2, partial [Racocetra persica]